MKCPHCGEELPEGFTYNEPTENDIVAVNSEADIVSVSPQVKKSINKKLIAALAAAVIIIIGAITASGIISRNKLEKRLLGTWQANNDIFSSIFSSDTLTFNDGVLSYGGGFGFFTGSNEYEYKISSGSSIKINGQKYKLYFSDNNSVLTIIPGLDGSNSQKWYKSETAIPQVDQQNVPESDNGGTI